MTGGVDPTTILQAIFTWMTGPFGITCVALGACIGLIAALFGAVSWFRFGSALAGGVALMAIAFFVTTFIHP